MARDERRRRTQGVVPGEVRRDRGPGSDWSGRDYDPGELPATWDDVKPRPKPKPRAAPVATKRKRSKSALGRKPGATAKTRGREGFSGGAAIVWSKGTDMTRMSRREDAVRHWPTRASGRAEEIYDPERGPEGSASGEQFRRADRGPTGAATSRRGRSAAMVICACGHRSGEHGNGGLPVAGLSRCRTCPQCAGWRPMRADQRVSPAGQGRSRAARRRKSVV